MISVLGLFLSLLISISALAEQSIHCRETNALGSLKGKGLELDLSLSLKNTGSVQTKRLDFAGLEQMQVKSVRQGIDGMGMKRTTFFLSPPSKSENFDIQLGFEINPLQQSFSDVDATLTIASANAKPENQFAYGYSVTCDASLK